MSLPECGPQDTCHLIGLIDSSRDADGRRPWLPSRPQAQGVQSSADLKITKLMVLKRTLELSELSQAEL